MGKTTEEIEVKYTADSKDYIKNVDAADKATEQLGDSIEDVDNKTSLIDDSLGGLNDSLGATTEGAIDAATGFSGMGAAVTTTAKSLVTATRSMSTFSKAMLATGIGAAVVAIGYLAANWDKVTDALGFTTNAQDDLNDAMEANLEIQRELLAIELQIENITGSDRTKNDIKKKQIQIELNALLREQNEIIQDWLTNFGAIPIEVLKADDAYKKLELQIKLLLLQFEQLAPPNSEDAPAIKYFGTDLPKAIDLSGKALDDFIAKLDKAIIKQRETEFGFLDQEIDEEEETQDAGFEHQIQAQKDFLKELAAEKAKEKKLFEDTEKAKEFAVDAGISSISRISQAAAKDNQKAQGAIMIGEAIANTAVAIIRQFRDLPYPVALPASIGIAALGAAQIAQIASAMGTGGAQAPSAPSPQVAATPTESAVNTSLFRLNPPQQPQVVLVTEDLNAVQQRVAVTNDRASLG